MSRVSGEKARAAITRRRRTAQRVKDRLAKAAAFAKPAAAPKAGKQASGLRPQASKAKATRKAKAE